MILKNRFIKRNIMSGVLHVSCLLMKIRFDGLSPSPTLYLSRQHLSSIRVSLISLKTSQSYNEKQVFFSFLRWKKITKQRGEQKAQETQAAAEAGVDFGDSVSLASRLCVLIFLLNRFQQSSHLPEWELWLFYSGHTFSSQVQVSLPEMFSSRQS